MSDDVEPPSAEDLERIPLCMCAEIYSRHHPECPVVRALRARDARIAELEAALAAADERNANNLSALDQNIAAVGRYKVRAERAEREATRLRGVIDARDGEWTKMRDRARNHTARMQCVARELGMTIEQVCAPAVESIIEEMRTRAERAEREREVGASVAAGDLGTATAGDEGTATAGDEGTATAGYRGTATAGDLGTLILYRWDGSRRRVHVAYVGEDGIKPDVAYMLDADGRFAALRGKEESET